MKRHTEDPWAVYRPTAEAPWNCRRVVHLHRRAGFAASWPEIQRDLKDGPAASTTRILEGKVRAPLVAEGFGETQRRTRGRGDQCG